MGLYKEKNDNEIIEKKEIDLTGIWVVLMGDSLEGWAGFLFFFFNAFSDDNSSTYSLLKA